MSAATTEAPPLASPQPAGNHRPRFGRWTIVLLALVGILVVVAVANVVVLLNEPGPAQPDCRRNQPCIPPPAPGAVTLGTRWTSSDLGYSFEYPTAWLNVVAEDDRGVRFRFSYGAVQGELWVSGAPTREVTPTELFRQRRDALAQRVVGLQDDNDSPERVVSPSLGFVPGVGSSFAGTLDTASGPSSPATVAILASGDGTVNVVLSLLIAGANVDHKLIQGLRIATGRLVVDTMKWRV